MLLEKEKRRKKNGSNDNKKKILKKEVLEAKEVIVIDFWATWCMPCKRQGVILEEMAASGVNVGKIDVDEQPELAAQFGVMSIPTLFDF